MKNEHLKFVIDSRYFRGSCITSMSDGLHCDYSGRTLEDLKIHENNPFLIAITQNAIYKISRIYDKSLCCPFHEITEENYYDNMDILPPVHLKHHSFFIGEPYHGNLYMFCFNINKQFFKGLRSIMTPQAELERQMNEHYHNITFRGKITKEKSHMITDKEKQEISVTPYSFIDKEGKERFICNMVYKQEDTKDICKARKDMANTLLSLRKHHFQYFSGHDKNNDIETFLDEVEKKEYTMVANGCFFQFPVRRDSVSFTGSVKETGDIFFYRIYDRELFLHIIYRLRAIKREKVKVQL